MEISLSTAGETVDMYELRSRVDKKKGRGLIGKIVKSAVPLDVYKRQAQKRSDDFGHLVGKYITADLLSKLTGYYT